MKKTIILTVFAFSLSAIAGAGAFAQSDTAGAETELKENSVPLAPSESSLSSPADAVKNTRIAPETLILRKIEAELQEKYRTEIYVTPSIPSLIFTPTQQSLLREARSGFSMDAKDYEDGTGEAAPGGAGEEAGPVSQFEQAPVSEVASIRTLSLGGIVFINPNDWTIWLNQKLISPGKIPDEIRNLRVAKDFIELQWFDAQTNQVFPVRLRPNQTFNLDARIFTPG